MYTKESNEKIGLAVAASAIREKKLVFTTQRTQWYKIKYIGVGVWVNVQGTYTPVVVKNSAGEWI